MDMRSNKVLSSIIASMLVLMAIVVVLPASAQAAWSDNATMSFSPKEMYPGGPHAASYTLALGAADDGVTKLTISNVWIQYGWESASHDILASSGDRVVTTFPSQVSFTNQVQVPNGQSVGSYTVNATVWAYTNDEPSSLVTHTFTGSITISDPITATATATPTTGTAPEEVSFDVTTSGGSGAYTYAWNFGDGTTGSGKSPNHTYTTGGSFTANVTVTDDLGMSTYDRTGVITIAPGIIVTIKAQPSSGPYPLEVAFNNTVANAAAGDLTYAWDFGDGSTSTDSAPTHTYEDEGVYSVVLTVTDSKDRTGTSSAPIHVSASATVEATITATPSSGKAPLAVAFTSNVAGGTYPYTYAWDFGDGASSTEANPSHTYSESGIYNVKLTVTDSASRQVTSEVTVTVKSDTTMAVTISAANMTGSKPLTVNFNSAIVDGTGPFFYTWSFDDNTSSNQANPVHIFKEAREYHVTLSVQDSLSNVTISNELTIVVSDPPAATIPAWVLIWGSTAAIIVAVGVIAFLMMRRNR
jgi:PKD repeat protein